MKFDRTCYRPGAVRRLGGFGAPLPSIGLMSDQPHLLIVTDNDDSRRGLLERLSELGYEGVAFAQGAQDALAALGATPFDLVLLDITVPDEGYALLQRMRSDTAWRHVPVVVISTLTDTDSVARCIDLGADDYLTEPFNPTLLRARIISSLKRKKHREMERLFLEYHDAVTGLPNKAMLMRWLQDALLTTHGAKERFGVLRVNVPQLLRVAETFGRQACDEVAQEVFYRFIAQTVQPTAWARIGTDEFGGVMAGITSTDEVIRFGRKLQGCMEEPFEVEGQVLTMAADVGITWPTAEAADAEILLRNADSAAALASKDNTRFRVFDEAVHRQTLARLKLEEELRRALDGDELVLFYQPIFRVSDLRLKGFEALIRWRHPGRGLVSPGEFIPIAEDTGLIVRVGRFAANAAAQCLAGWRAVYPDAASLTINVNVSGDQIIDGDVIADFEQAVHDFGLTPGAIELELTESVLIRDPDQAAAALNDLSGRGFRCVIDDFGTGYSSLSYLHRYPFHTLKIDRSFIRSVHENKKNREIVRAIIDLAHHLDMSVVVEGVETAEELAVVQDFGADYAQGFFLGRPVPEHEAARWCASMGP